ncbi:unnamed protein product [Microthlaspi erraticum]|uniref:Uncharacterized protein n=1 Tax=Microthlaspi erraticum TaxID=1685480 RepID=A0A6D2L5T3_9BRAS|nr:unnamed protein product [Microthlaspi erraticum]
MQVHHLPLLLGTPFLSTVGASIDFHKQEVILHKVVKERLTKNQELGRIRLRKGVDRGPRIEKPRLERARVEKPRLIGHELIDLFKPLVCLMKRAFKLCLMSH